MEGRLVIEDAGGTQVVPLAKEGVTRIGGDPHSEIQIGALDPGVICHAILEWDRNQSNWVISRQASAGEVWVEGGQLADGIKVPLTHRGHIRIFGREMRFERVLADPLVDGGPMHTIPLKKVELLVFGRGEGKAASPEDGGGQRICLDAEDRRISSVHIVVEKSGDDYSIVDKSRFGSLLNGSAFSRELLVYGDRFQIEDYTFEFLVDRIRRVDGSGGGLIQARDLEVLVKKRVPNSRKKVLGPILTNINVDIRPGQFVGILGGSGSGKSTLMNALCGINPGTSGRVCINGVEISNRAAMIAAGIGYVPQDDIVHRELTVTEALRLGARLRLKLSDHAINSLVDRVIQNLGMKEHATKRISNLSGGQRKRVSIGTELLCRPSVLFLDEPTSGLDPVTETELMGWLQTLSKTGTTVICTTHDLQNAHLFERLLIVEKGRIVFSGDHRAAREHFLGRQGTVDQSSAVSQSVGSRKLASLVRVYEEIKNSKRSAEDWQSLYERSPFFDAPSALIQTAEKLPKLDASRRIGPLRTLSNLVKRQWKVFKADVLNVLFLIVQAVFIGGLVGWVSDDSVLRNFLVIVATLWFGCSNGAQQIVGEISIFRRERVSGQGLNPYVWSKFLFLTLLTSMQAGILMLVTYSSAHVFHPTELEDGKDRKLEEQIVKRIFPRPNAKASEEMQQRFLDIQLEETEKRMFDEGVVVDVEPGNVSGGLFSLPNSKLPELFFTVSKNEWAANKETSISTGQTVRLPAALEDYPEGGVVAKRSRPGLVESPYAPGHWRQISIHSSSQSEGATDPRERWKAGMQESCPITGQIFLLPQKLASWPTDSLRYSGLWYFLRFFMLEDAFLDSGKSLETNALPQIGVWDIILSTFGLKVCALLMTAFVGVAIGLTVSSLVQNVTQAVMWVPLVLIPQILFGGFVVTIPEMTPSVRAFSYVVPSFAAQHVMDVSNVFGRIVPKVSNQTKLPVFTKGDGEEVVWYEEGDEKTQKYDKAVGGNTSWQNLLVLPKRVGQRRIEKEYITVYDDEGSFVSRLSTSNDTVNSRSDIRRGYEHGTRYQYLAEAQKSLLVLGAWLLGCYTIILIGLLSRQTGK